MMPNKAELKRKIDHVFIILTPFHLKMMEKIFSDQLYAENTLIFYSDFVKLENNKFNGVLLKNEFYLFSINQLIKNPIHEVYSARKEISRIQNFCGALHDRFGIKAAITITIGTEKDIFTQVLLNYLYRSSFHKVVLNAVEEGLGYYAEENRTDMMKALLYKFLTPLLFNEKLNYHNQLGTDVRINNVYARLPHLIPNSRNKHIIKIETETNLKNSVKGYSNKILIYSFPNIGYKISDKRKKDIFITILKNFKNGKTVYIKPHPRESIEVFKEIKDIELLEKSNSGESLNYFEFDEIIHFSSSIIIDLLDQKYPKEKIFTIIMKNSNFHLFKGTRCIKLKELKNISFED